jgi:hypothetical protein
MQVRNGWRPHGRRLDQPAAPSKNGRFFVQPMGSTSIIVDKNKPSIHDAPIDSITGLLEESQGDIILATIFIANELLFVDRHQSHIRFRFSFLDDRGHIRIEEWLN